jgi:hypothetical protein
MKTQEFVSIYRDAGFNIKTIEGLDFYQQGLLNYSYPNLVTMPINDAVINAVKWKYPISMILTNLQRKNTYEFILHTNDYSIDRFAKKIRNRIRKSLQNCTFNRPGLEEMKTSGLYLNRQTLKRQNRSDKTLTDARIWSNYVTSLYNHNEVDFLGAYYSGRMVGYIIAAKLEEKYIIVHAFIDRNDSETTDPMNGLIFTLVNQLINKKETVTISYGLDSFLPLVELNRFKSNMLFERIPVSRAYIIHPVLLLFIRLVIFYYINILEYRNVRNSFTRKLIRLYQGYRLYFRECNSCIKKPAQKIVSL